MSGAIRPVRIPGRRARSRPPSRRSAWPGGRWRARPVGGLRAGVDGRGQHVYVPTRVLTHHLGQQLDGSLVGGLRKAQVLTERDAELAHHLPAGQHLGPAQRVSPPLVPRPALVFVVEQRGRGHGGDVVHTDRGADGGGVGLVHRADGVDLRGPDPDVLHEVARPQVGPGEPGVLDGLGDRSPPVAGIAREVDDVANSRVARHRQHLPHRLGHGGQIHPVHAFKGGGEGVGPPHVRPHHLDLLGQARPPRSVGQRTDVAGTGGQQVIDDFPSDVAGGAGDKDLHRASPSRPHAEGERTMRFCHGRTPQNAHSTSRWGGAGFPHHPGLLNRSPR